MKLMNTDTNAELLNRWCRNTCYQQILNCWYWYRTKKINLNKFKCSSVCENKIKQFSLGPSSNLLLGFETDSNNPHLRSQTNSNDPLLGPQMKSNALPWNLKRTQMIFFLVPQTNSNDPTLRPLTNSNDLYCVMQI